MRPQSIVNFERLIFASLGLGVIQSYLAWDQLTQMGSAGFVLFVQLFVFLLMVGLTLLVSRRRSKIAMWISIALFALGLPWFIQMLLQGIMPGSAWISVAQTILQLFAFGLLFTPSARDWLNGTND